MEKIAFLMDGAVIYWSSVVMVLAVATAICGFLALYLGRDGSVAAAAVCIPLALVLSLVFSRAAHWYFRENSYAGFAQAMEDFSGGGFALPGAFVGCIASAVLLRILCISRDLTGMLDCMSIAGSAGIAVGRLSSAFNTSGRGFLMQTGALPWVAPMENPVSGIVEYRLATFLLQAVAAGGICLMLFLFWLIRGKEKLYRKGDTCLLFALLYGASQVILDSTRYDSLYFRSNGFVSVEQVLGALGIVLAVTVFFLRLMRIRRRKGYLLLWLAAATLLGTGGYMEYHVQRHGNDALFAYGIMGSCLLGVVILAVSFRGLAVREEKRRQANGAWME